MSLDFSGKLPQQLRIYYLARAPVSLQLVLNLTNLLVLIIEAPVVICVLRSGHKRFYCSRFSAITIALLISYSTILISKRKMHLIVSVVKKNSLADGICILLGNYNFRP